MASDNSYLFPKLRQEQIYRSFHGISISIVVSARASLLQLLLLLPTPQRSLGTFSGVGVEDLILVFAPFAPTRRFNYRFSTTAVRIHALFG